MNTALELRATSDFDLLTDPKKFEQLQRAAGVYASSDLVPEHYRGKEKLANVVIALQMSMRMGVDPMTFLQSSYIVHGKPGVEAKLAIALLNASGRIKGSIRYEMSADGKECTAYAIDKASGETVQEKCTMAIADKEGWIKKAGSKWQTMPELMLKYRSAMFLIRLHYPEVILGMQSVEELHDCVIDGNVIERPKIDHVEAAKRKRAKLTLAECQTLEDVEQVRSEMLQRAKTNEDFDAVHDVCDARMSELKQQGEASAV